MREAIRTSRIGLIIPIILLAVVVLLQAGSLRAVQAQIAAAAGVVNEKNFFSFSGLNDELREEFHQSNPLSPEGRVSLENINGAVKIKVWDRNEVQVDAVKHAYRKERLVEVRIEIDATPDFVRIRTRYPEHNENSGDDERGRYNNPASVEYSVTVPRRARLESVDLVNGALDVDSVEGGVKASCVNGRLTARGLTGEAKLSTVNGPLEALFARLDETKAISLGSVNGPVSLTIPSNSNATIKANTVHGPISNDFGLEVQDGEYVGHDLHGQLGTGGPRIKVGNVNGGISIKRAQDGQSVSSATSLLQKDKQKQKVLTEDEVASVSESARASAAQASQEAVARVDAARIAREARAETQREVERAIREAQHEIQRAQIEVQRETRRQIRDEVRGRAEAGDKARGEGRGGNRFVERESQSFAVTGNPSVNIVTYDGFITVHGWDKSVVKYDVSKRAGEEQDVKQIKVEAKQDGSTISIVARAPQAEGSASLDVYVPKNANLHVSSNDGRLSLEGVSGDLTLRTGDGSIDVTDGRGQLQVNTGDGRIHVTKFEGQVDARTGDGSIVLEGAFSGLAARTGDGTISLAVPADSHFTIETNADSISNEGLTVSEDIAPSKRVKRWKVGRGGNVFVLSTGEGKIVLRPR